MTKKSKRAPSYEPMYGTLVYDNTKKSTKETLEILKNDVARHNAEHAQMLAFLTELQLRTGEILAILKDDVPKPMMVGVYPKPVEGNTEPLWEEE